MKHIIPELLVRVLSIANLLIPKRKDMIAIYGRKMLNDNAEAFLQYIINHGYSQKYKVYLLVHKDVKHKFKDCVHVVSNDVSTVYYTLRVKYLFHTHGMSLCKHIPCRGQIVFNLWHGSPLKAIGAMLGYRIIPEVDSYFLCASPMFAEINKKCFLISDDQIFIGSNPRNDFLFNRIDVKRKMGWEKYSKLMIFMPTFRRSNGLNRFDAGKDFPILNSNNIKEMDTFLGEINVLLIIKPHPYQNYIEFLHGHYDNIKVIHNVDLHTIGVRLYELLGESDALITDFSSVYFDYLLTGKPIGFAIDDYDNYAQARGYTIENPLDVMPGKKIKTVKDLKTFATDVSVGNDCYASERRRVNGICNTYTTPDASRRILDFCGITL